jgi:hypothetical protein
MSTDMTVATTILQQLGGRRFQTMTGAHSFSGDTNALVFKFPGAKDRIFACRIMLTPADDYTLAFYRKRGRYNVEVAEELDGIYCDQLQEVFSRVTGLATHL